MHYDCFIERECCRLRVGAPGVEASDLCDEQIELLVANLIRPKSRHQALRVANLTPDLVCIVTR